MTEPTSASAPRAGFFSRLGHLAIVRILVEAAGLVITMIVASRLLSVAVPPAPSPWHADLAMLRNLILMALVLSVYISLVRWLEHRRAGELAPGPGAAQLPAGALIGVALMASVFLVLRVMGLASLSPGDGASGLLAGLIAATLAAVFEELLLRAVLFRIVEQAFGTTVALLVSAAVFGLLHGLNPGATLFSDAAIAIEAGLLLAMAYALTRNLWFAIGIHLGWNFTEGNLIGVPVSGGASTHSLFRAVLHGPDLLTGAAFGPEASVITIGVCVFATLVFGVFVVRGGGWRPLSRRLTIA